LRVSVVMSALSLDRPVGRACHFRRLIVVFGLVPKQELENEGNSIR